MLNLKKLGIAILLILIFLFIGAAGVYLNIVGYAQKPPNTAPVEQAVIVQSGQGFKALSNLLYQKGMILHPVKFRLFARIKGHDKRIKAGEYMLSSAMTPKKILETMVDGKVYLHRLTIPEGYNLRQVAQAVGTAGLASESDFLKATTDPDLLNANGIDARTFEGYLFPDTYYFPRDVTSENIITTMVKRFWSVFNPEWKEQTKTLEMTIHQVITLASIIEKETAVAAERPIISSVFHNRLKRNMRLESDPTVIYGMGDYNGNITRKDLESPTRYNTYTMKGLPPGPISNTGAKAIEAALYPADTKFLYFVSRNDRTHHFSTNFRDHNRAVRKYQLGK
ncbi:MAG TPA: endolytic transglycosylase MltG [Desulfobacteraceae bacterium]|nr:endolytic transglycosylase MltG [Desulfobacteraceae bacterium]